MNKIIPNLSSSHSNKHVFCIFIYDFYTLVFEFHTNHIRYLVQNHYVGTSSKWKYWKVSRLSKIDTYSNVFFIFTNKEIPDSPTKSQRCIVFKRDIFLHNFIITRYFDLSTV